MSGLDVSRETAQKVEHFSACLVEENRHQNLIAPSTVPDIIDRHILDSAMLVKLEPDPTAHWYDIGSGPGLPGLVIALINDGPATLVEPRRLRVEFMQRMIEELALGHRTRVILGKAAHADGRAEVITGRAVASLERFFDLCAHLSTEKTHWILPKGRNAQSELEQARRIWQGSFRLEPSLTDPASSVVVAKGVKRRGMP